nr:RNA-directed DNA polymerase, eukaryota, reverse transcriptase zinc-binding domain protein [Tanacetum cinerariifolium]
MGVPYTEDEIMAIVREGKQRGHIPDVGRVLLGQGMIIPPPPPCTHSFDVVAARVAGTRMMSWEMMRTAARMGRMSTIVRRCWSIKELSSKVVEGGLKSVMGGFKVGEGTSKSGEETSRASEGTSKGDHRGIGLHTTRCPLCNEDLETSQHIFVDRPIATVLWNRISRWWGMVNYPKTLLDLSSWAD